MIVNKLGNYKQHAHVLNKNTAHNLIKLLDKGLMPTSAYLKESARRLLNDEEFKMLLEKDREHYININKGVRKR